MDLASLLPVEEPLTAGTDEDPMPDDRAVVSVGGRRFWIPTLAEGGVFTGVANVRTTK